MPFSKDFSYRCACADWMVVHPVFAGRMLSCPKCHDPVIAPRTEGESAEKIDGARKLLTERLEIHPAELAAPSDN